jgi:hypothetical protein
MNCNTVEPPQSFAETLQSFPEPFQSCAKTFQSFTENSKSFAETVQSFVENTLAQFWSFCHSFSPLKHSWLTICLGHELGQLA